MFAQFSLFLSHIFRLRSRRSANANDDSARVARRSTSEPSPSPSESHRPALPQLEPINTTPTTQPPSLFTHTLLSPIAQSPTTTSSHTTPIPDTLTPILIIGHDPVQSTPPRSPTTPALPSNVGSQTDVDGISPLESPPAPTHPNTRRVSFQLPTTHMEEPPESPLSTCSTLVPDAEPQVEAEIRSAVPPERPAAPEAPDSGPAVPTASAEPDVELEDVVRSSSGRARFVSFLSPQPARVDVSRFSVPVMPTVPMMTPSTNQRDGRREGKRISLMSLLSGSGSAKKERRSSRWDRELNKPETQEVLRVLSEL